MARTLLRTAEGIVVLVCVVALVLAFSRESNRAERDVRVSAGGLRPVEVSAPLGATVRWTFSDAGRGLSQPQGFWRSGPRPEGAVFSVEVPDAGTYRYRSVGGGSGLVRVPVLAGGAANLGWTLTWSRRATASITRRYDVQVQAPGSRGWVFLRRATADRSAVLDPPDQGRYRVRARTRLGGTRDARACAWSPVLTVRIS